MDRRRCDDGTSCSVAHATARAARSARSQVTAANLRLPAGSRHTDTAGTCAVVPRRVDLRGCDEAWNARSRFGAFGVACAGIVLGVIALRFGLDGSRGWGAVYGYPDPQVCNTLTKYATLSVLAFLISSHDELREDLLAVVVYGYIVSVVASLSWLLFGDLFSDVRVLTRGGEKVRVDWYFALNVAMDGGVAAAIVGLRRMYFNVDHGIVALAPSSARSVMALHGALHPGSDLDSGAVARSVDRHVSNIRGRKRGLLNVPFGLLEHAIGVLYGFRPAFSSMAPTSASTCSDRGCCVLRQNGDVPSSPRWLTWSTSSALRRTLS